MNNKPTQTEPNEEDKELQEIKNVFNKAPKFSKWRELYFDKDNKLQLKTFVNATLSAIHAYGLDINSPDDRQYASELGYKNTRKCKNWAREYLSSIGTTPEVVLKTLAVKSLSTDNPRYFQMLMEIMDIYNPKPNTLVQNNIQTNIDIEVSEAEKKEVKDAFKRFLENEQ